MKFCFGLKKLSLSDFAGFSPWLSDLPVSALSEYFAPDFGVISGS